MNEEMKKAIYEGLLKDYPITYEQISDEQFQSLANTFAGTSILLSLALRPIKEVTKSTFKDVSAILRGIKL